MVQRTVVAGIAISATAATAIMVDSLVRVTIVAVSAFLLGALAITAKSER